MAIKKQTGKGTTKGMVVASGHKKGDSGGEGIRKQNRKVTPYKQKTRKSISDSVERMGGRMYRKTRMYACIYLHIYKPMHCILRQLTINVRVTLRRNYLAVPSLSQNSSRDQVDVAPQWRKASQ